MDESDGGPLVAPRELTVGQRVAFRLCVGFANDLERGTVADQYTAALLRVVADAIEHDYEAELVALVRAWRREREAGNAQGE
jgi:hypothetical protein